MREALTNPCYIPLGTLPTEEKQQHFLVLSAQGEEISDIVALEEALDSWWKLCQTAFLSSGHGACRDPS